MKYQAFKFIILAAILAGFTSCVSQLKYNRLSAEVSGLRNERDEALKKSEQLRVEDIVEDKEQKNLVDNLVQANKYITRLKHDSALTTSMYNKLNDVHERLNASYNSLLANTSTDKAMTEKELLRKEQDLVRREKELADAKSEMAATQLELGRKKDEALRLNQDLGSKDNRIKEMEAQMAAKDKAMLDIKAKMTSALLTLGNSNLQVSQKDGKVYVVLPNQTLFSTGSYALQPAGKDAVSRVAMVLMQNPDLEVSVEGHTDVSPFKPKAAAPMAKKGKKPVKPAAAPSVIKDNWDLSSLRAATVARELYLQGIAGSRISATGKGEFYPLDLSFSEEARMRNRRIEMVISPKLSALYQMLNNNEQK